MNSCLVFFHQPINIAYLGKKKKKKIKKQTLILKETGPKLSVISLCLTFYGLGCHSYCGPSPVESGTIQRSCDVS